MDRGRRVRGGNGLSVGLIAFTGVVPLRHLAPCSPMGFQKTAQGRCAAATLGLRARNNTENPSGVSDISLCVMQPLQG
jgi:hypothetical protein